MQPRPGAYERMRFAMTNPPAVSPRQESRRVRRATLGLAAALMAVAIVAALLYVGRISHPNANVPAQPIVHASPVSPPSPTSRPSPTSTPLGSFTHILSNASGTGSTMIKAFDTSGSWGLAWSYNCSNIKHSGNFRLVVTYTDGTPDTDQPPVNVTGSRGSGYLAYNTSSSQYITVTTACRWQETAGYPR